MKRNRLNRPDFPGFIFTANGTFEKLSIAFKFKPACALHADREGDPAMAGLTAPEEYASPR
jgi:hypothetical protein